MRHKKPSQHFSNVEATGIKHSSINCCDVKEDSFTFVRRNHRGACGCFFKSLAEASAPTQICKMHSMSGANIHECDFWRESFRDEREPIDICEVDAPCQPYSRMRHKGETSPQDHPGYGITFSDHDSLLQFHRTHLAHWIVGEQVKVFAETGPHDNDDGDDDSLRSTSYLDVLMGEIGRITDKNDKRKYVGKGAVLMNASQQTEARRERRANFSKRRRKFHELE